MMQIEERTLGAVTILDLKGKLTLGDGDVALKDKVRTLVNRGCRHLVLNLAEVPHVDSVGIGEIVGTYTTITQRGGSLRLLYVPKRIRDLLVITKLLTVFETFDSETEAVKSFFPPEPKS
jgi:anti-sigma B factor antagonist